MHFAKISCLAAVAGTVSAYGPGQRSFAVNHFYGKGPLTIGRADPIVSPGVASGHVHAIQGGNAFALSMADGQAQQSTCTSSRIKNDKSNYWTPSLYFKDPQTGQLEAVEMFYMNVYYFFEGTTDKIQAFPDNLRMLIGNPTLRTPPASGGKTIIDLKDGTPSPVSWTCPRSNANTPLYPADSDGLHGVGIQAPNNKGSGVGFPDKNCDGYASPLRADIHFPSCYNPAVSVSDFKNNMQYPSNGNCPTGWIHTPHLFYEVYWNTPQFANRWTQGQGSQPFVLSNGDPTGYGLHGDFLNGWDRATLQQMIDNCDAGDAGMDKCPGLIGGINDPSTSCNIPNPFLETVAGVMNALPGNNPVGQWGVNAAAPPAAAPPAASGPAPAGSKAASVPAYTLKAASTAAPIASSAASKPKPATTSNAGGAVKTVSVVPIAATPTAGKAVTMVTSIVSAYTTIYTTVTAPLTAATGAPAVVGGTKDIASGWSYHGCYADTQNRVMTGIKFANIGNKQVTSTKCVDYCNKAGFSMAGTEYGGQCFCSNTLVGSSKVDEATCSMKCEGDASQTCGGGMTLSVYSKTAAKKRSPYASPHLHRHLKSLFAN